MRHRLSWADLAGERIGVWGLGTEGTATLRRLRSMGLDAVVVDDRPEQLSEPGVLATDAGGLDALAGCSVVIKTPGLSRYRHDVRALEDAGVAIVGGLGLWLEEADRARVLCITGTKGKSTTTSIAAHLATNLGLRVFAGGNLGLPPYDPDAPTDVDLWVIEVSSYQATEVASTPPVVAVTSLDPDHLPWHGGVETYYADKLSLCTQPGAQLTIAAATSPPLVQREHLLGPQVRWVDADTWPPAWAAPLGMLGVHNLVNANIARACLEALGVPGADDDATLARAGEGFAQLESRLEHVACIDGVDFIDDGLSTNVLPTLAAIDAFPGRRVALIAGGLDRGVDYRPLAESLVERDAPTLVLAVYETGPKILGAFEGLSADTVELCAAADLEDAVVRGFEWARPDGVVLLSPAAASFDAFDDYRDRGRVFRSAVQRLSGDGLQREE